MFGEVPAPAPAPLRVLVVEPHRYLRAVLSWLVGHDDRFTVAGETDRGEDAVGWPQPYDVALVQLSECGLGGADTIGRLLRRDPPAVTVVMSDTGAAYLRAAASAEGAGGFLVGPEDFGALTDRLAEIAGLLGCLPAGLRPGAGAALSR